MIRQTYRLPNSISAKSNSLKALRAELRGMRLFSRKYSDYLATGQSCCNDIVGLSAESKNMMSVHLVQVLADIDKLETYINGKLLLYEDYEEF